MIQLTSDNIEQIAAEIFKQYKRHIETEWDVIYVDPIRLAEMFGHKVEFFDFGESSETLGFTLFNDLFVTLTDASGNQKRMYLTEGTIVINEALKDGNIGRLNFTIMHEISHHIINRMCSAKYNIKFRNQPHYETRSGQYLPEDYDEYLANKLASAILMPKEILDIVFENVFKTSYVKRINSILDRRAYRGLCAIAKLFGVSRQALSIRLKRLGKLGEYQYSTYNDIIGVFPEKVIA